MTRPHHTSPWWRDPMITGEGVGEGVGARGLGRGSVGLVSVSLVLLLVTAFAGESAAVPGLGGPASHPAWSLDLGWPAGLVTIVLVAAYVLGAAGVVLGLLAIRAGARIRPRRVVLAAAVVLVAIAVVPPMGSGDHLNYAAYGRIAAAGDDPYVQRPSTWHGGNDPVASAAQPPWTGTRSVYGPLATTLQAAASMVGGDSLRLTVWAWHLLVLIAFALTAWMLDALARRASGGGRDDDEAAAARTRVALLWTLNPLVLGPAVLGSHVDVIGVAFVVATLVLTRRAPLVAGLALGAAASTKLPYALVGLAVLWGLRRLPARRALAVAAQGLCGVVVALAATHWGAGDHVYDQLERARRYVSLATPWRPLVDVLDPVLGTEPVRAAVASASLVAAVVAAALVALATRRQPVRGPDPVTADAVRATCVLGAGWLLAAPYALPWYDVLLWAPLALLAGGVLDAVVLTRSAVLAIAYVPGRVVGLSPLVEQTTLGFRARVAPWLILAVLVWLVVEVASRLPLRPRPARRRPAPASARLRR